MIAILFDIDGTLIQTGGAGRIAFAETFRELFGVDELSGRTAFAGRSDRAIAEELMLIHGLNPTPQNWRRFIDGFVPRLREALPKCTGNVLPGVVELLDSLAAVDRVLIGLLTGNVAAGAHAKLSHFDLYDRFLFGGFGDVYTTRDEIAGAALAAARDYAANVINKPLSEGEVIVIGDTPADIQCARAIGAWAVAVATGGATYQDLASAGPDLLLENLSDVEQLLMRVNGAFT